MKPVELEVVRHEFGGATCEVVLPPRLSGPGDMQWGECRMSSGHEVVCIYGAKNQPGREVEIGKRRYFSADMGAAYRITNGGTIFGSVCIDGLTPNQITNRLWQRFGLPGSSDTLFAAKVESVLREGDFWSRCIDKMSHGALDWIRMFHDELRTRIQAACTELPEFLQNMPSVLNGIYAHGAIAEEDPETLAIGRSPADAHVFVYGFSNDDVRNPLETYIDVNARYEIRQQMSGSDFGRKYPYDKLNNPIYDSVRNEGPRVGWEVKTYPNRFSSATCFTDGFYNDERSIVMGPEGPLFQSAQKVLHYPNSDDIATHVAKLREKKIGLSDDAIGYRIKKHRH